MLNIKIVHNEGKKSSQDNALERLNFMYENFEILYSLEMGIVERTKECGGTPDKALLKLGKKCVDAKKNNASPKELKKLLDEFQDALGEKYPETEPYQTSMSRFPEGTSAHNFEDPD
jgi:hypothetical protein